MKRMWLWIVVATFLPIAASAQDNRSEDTVVFGIKIRAGGRYDDVRMCVATSAGTKIGPAMDVSFFTEFGLRDDLILSVNLPVLRPILFVTNFQLGFSPYLTPLFSINDPDSHKGVVAGGSLDALFSFHP